MLNCVRLLTRILSYIFEDPDWRGFFWSTLPRQTADESAEVIAVKHFMLCLHFVSSFKQIFYSLSVCLSVCLSVSKKSRFMRCNVKGLLPLQFGFDSTMTKNEHVHSFADSNGYSEGSGGQNGMIFLCPLPTVFS